MLVCIEMKKHLNQMYISLKYQKILKKEQKVAKTELNRSAKTMIGKAVKKHGSENFENHIIEWCESKEKLNEREIYWISKYNSFANTGIGYNLARGGNQVNPLHAYTEEQLKEYGEKISKSNTGKKRSEEFEEIFVF